MSTLFSAHHSPIKSWMYSETNDMDDSGAGLSTGSATWDWQRHTHLVYYYYSHCSGAQHPQARIRTLFKGFEEGVRALVVFVVKRKSPDKVGLWMEGNKLSACLSSWSQQSLGNFGPWGHLEPFSPY